MRKSKFILKCNTHTYPLNYKKDSILLGGCFDLPKLKLYSEIKYDLVGDKLISDIVYNKNIGIRFTIPNIVLFNWIPNSFMIHSRYKLKNKDIITTLNYPEYDFNTYFIIHQNKNTNYGINWEYANKDYLLSVCMQKLIWNNNGEIKMSLDNTFDLRLYFHHILTLNIKLFASMKVYFINIFRYL